MKKTEKQIGVGTFTASSLAKSYVQDVLNSNRLSYGPYSKKFEDEFAKLHDRRFGIFSNSGTSALQISLAALKEKYNWRDGDEVIVPAVTFVASSNIVLQNDMVPVFVDVDAKTYNINASLIGPAISSKTRAIIPVHLFGLSCEMREIKEVADKYGLKILEDSCEAMFVKYCGRPVGSTGDISCFSTYVAHLLITGVGGLSLTNDPELAVLMRSLCNHGRDSIYLSIDDDKGIGQEKMKMVVSRRFSFERMGYSYRATELEAALGLAQIDENPMVFVRKRQSNAKMLINGLKKFGNNLQLPSWPRYSEHAFMMFPIVIHKECRINREDLVIHLEEHNVETRPMLPLLNQPFYKKIFGDIEKDYPVAEWINNNGFYIGCHQDLGAKDIQYIVDVFDDFFSKV